MKKKKNQKITISKNIRDLPHKCKDCGFVNIAVDKRYKYNEYLCIDCFKIRLLS